MKVSGIKYYKDKNSFRILENLGLNVEKIQDIEKTDEKIEDLINHNYKTIIITNEMAGFSQNIIEKYDKSNVNIIIMKNKNIKSE